MDIGAPKGLPCLLEHAFTNSVVKTWPGYTGRQAVGREGSRSGNGGNRDAQGDIKTLEPVSVALVSVPQPCYCLFP